MKAGDLGGRLAAFLGRYKYAAAVLLAGVALMLWPSGRKETPAPAVIAETQAADPLDGELLRGQTERELEAILSQIQGAGRVRVMLTLASGPATQYQRDQSRTERRSGEETQTALEEKTVMVDRGSAYNEPAVVARTGPVYRGALIVSQGGDDPEVRLRLTSAVAALLGLGTDRITVVKMK